MHWDAIIGTNQAFISISYSLLSSSCLWRSNLVSRSIIVRLDAVLALDISDHLASKYLFWDKNQSMVSLVVSNIDLKCPMLGCYG